MDLQVGETTLRDMRFPFSSRVPAFGQKTELALILMAVAALCIPSIDAIAKLLSASIPAGQVAWTRFLVQCLLLAPFIITVTRRNRPRHLLLQCLRGFLLAVTTVLIFEAVKWMPLADVIALFFVEPLLVALLSVIFLGEQIGWRRILAAIAGFCGALIIVRPSYGLFGLVSLLPLGAALCFAAYLILTRLLALRGEDPVLMQWLAGISGLVFMSFFLLAGTVTEIPLADPVWPNFYEWSLLILSGVIATVGHLMIVFAFRHAEAAVLAPFQYLEILGATALGFWLFGDFPDLLTWLGGSIVVGSGLYTYYRERRRLMRPGTSRVTSPRR